MPIFAGQSVPMTPQPLSTINHVTPPLIPVSKPCRHAYALATACRLHRTRRPGPALLLAVATVLDTRHATSWLFVLLIGAYGLVFAICGVLYVISSAKIKSGSLPWHHYLIVTAGVHIGVIIAWLGLLIWASSQTGKVEPLPFLVAALLLAALGQMIQKTKKSRAEYGSLPPV